MTPNEAKDIQEVAKQSSNDRPKVALADLFKSTKAELGKVVWPSRQQLFSESAAVLLMVVASASLVYLVDGLFSWISSRIFQ